MLGEGLTSRLDSRKRRVRRRRAVADAAAGVVGALVSLWVFFPIEVWKTTLQAGANRKSTSFGVMNMYQGCGVKSLHTVTSNFCYLFLYSWIVSFWTQGASKNNKPPLLNPGTRLVLSAVAAMLNTFLTLPLDVISSKQVTKHQEDETKPETRQQRKSNHPESDHC